MSRQAKPNPAGACCLVIVVIFVIAVVANAFGGDDGPETNRQWCEAESSQAVWSFDDCKEMFPGERGIGGWD
ncbi:hypothetical protein [Streptomyces sp. NPDC058084]|uniref:hypothetical protein n=1 Tax=Streptomyces sp. NPDC058084 TaxID=3346333 RepID=UPI0036EA5506